MLYDELELFDIIKFPLIHGVSDPLDLFAQIYDQFNVKLLYLNINLNELFCNKSF